ncbi:MAG: hypothetical protein QM526_01580 [Alphaproteobacteria bacterium]|nr:hypothetical protein [Alphaproteobacteria bacterium]
MTKNPPKKLVNALASVKRIPRALFIARNVFIWGVLAITTLYAGLYLSLSFTIAIDGGWYDIRLSDVTSIEYFFRIFPVWWILIYIALCVCIYIAFRYTNKGYRPTLYTIIGSTLIICVILALVGYVFPTVREKILFQKHWERPEAHIERALNNPERGTLVGEIDTIAEEYIVLHDRLGRQWTVRFEALDIIDTISLVQHLPVRVFGEKINEGVFLACDISPALSRAFEEKPMHRADTKAKRNAFIERSATRNPYCK